MKNNIRKNWLLIGMITIGTLASANAFAGKGDKKTLEDSKFTSRKEYKDMKATLSRIDDDQARIAFHKEAYKLNKKNGLKIESHMSLKEVRKAKADLKRDKKFLRIDRRDLKKDQKVALNEKCKAIRSNKKELRAAKRELRKDLRKDNTADIQQDVKQIERLSNALEAEKKETAQLYQDVDVFFASLDDEIKDTLKA
jgi:hypothetical protein